jgi:hypothetical protein
MDAKEEAARTFDREYLQHALDFIMGQCSRINTSTPPPYEDLRGLLAEVLQFAQKETAKATRE